MLNCETVHSVEDRDLTKWSRQRSWTFALVADYYTAARTQRDRGVLRDLLGQIISNLRDQFETEDRVLSRIRNSSMPEHRRMHTHLLAELRESLDLAESEDDSLTKLAHALDGLVIRQMRGEFGLLA